MKKLFLSFSVTIALSFCGGPSEVPSGALRGGNVLLVTIDTLRPDRLGAYGSKAGLSPHLDRLAAEGIRFENVLSHVPLTLPSHVSLFTGKLPVHHGVHDNGTFRLGATHETLATKLNAEGYDTAAFVGAFVLDARFGLDRGFDVYDDYYGEKRAFASFTEVERRAEAVLAPAEKWIESPHHAPWFVWIHLFDPHAPYEAPEAFRSRNPGDPYGAEVAYVDSALGDFLSRMESKGFLERTLVSVASDHGESLGEHGEETHGTFAYNATLSVPWILWAKGIEPLAFAPRARLVDVAPTLLDFLGVEAPPSIDGTSLRPFLHQPSEFVPPDSYFEALNPHLTRDWAPLRGIVRAQTKLIDLPIAEIYELDRDPKETTNLAGQRAALAKELRDALEAYALSSDESADIDADEETRRRLESLGYVVGRRSGAARESYSEEDDPKKLIAFVNAHDEASTLFQQGRTEEALALLRDVLSKQPRSSFAAQKLAYALHQLGRTAEAIRVLEEAVSRGITDLSLLALLGSYLIETGDIPRALGLLEPLAERHPDFAEAHNYLGVAYARLGRASDAQKEFERVLSLDPSSASASNNLGSLALGLGKTENAIRHLERALELDPGSASASNGLGVAKARNGDLDGAIVAWRRAVELNPSQYDALYNLALALEGRSRAEARVHLERFASEAPESRYRDDIRRARELLRQWGSPSF